MEEHRGGVGEAVDAAEVACLQGDELVVIANQQIALQYGYR